MHYDLIFPYLYVASLRVTNVDYVQFFKKRSYIDKNKLWIILQIYDHQIKRCESIKCFSWKILNHRFTVGMTSYFHEEK